MKKTVWFSIFLLLQMQSFGQTEWIELKDESSRVEKLIPKNWKVLSRATGDLNKDGFDDLALVVENTESKYFKANEGELGRDTINLNPRILAIYLANQKGKYVKKVQANEFILRQDSPTMDEPFDGIEIQNNGDLKIDFHFWYSAGSWNMSNHTYLFRFQNDKFELIEYESNQRHRATGESNRQTINFLIGKMVTTSTTIEENKQQTETKNKTFTLKELKSIESLGKPFEWEFNGIYI